MRRTKNERVTLRMPRGLVEDVERLVDGGYYPNRSEAIREASRRLLEELADEDDVDLRGPIAGADEADLGDPVEEAERRRQWREEAAERDDRPTLDHTDPEDLRLAYEAADGNVAAAAERFDVTYPTVWNRLVDAGIHEPNDRGRDPQEVPA